MSRFWIHFSLAVTLLAGLAACDLAPKINSAADLVAALQQEGVPIASEEPAPAPEGNRFRFDEGITVKGENLWIDILKITDQRVFDIAKSVGPLLGAVEAVAGQELPGKPDIYSRYPFVVIVRQQPEGANLLATLQELLPPEPGSA